MTKRYIIFFRTGTPLEGNYVEIYGASHDNARERAEDFYGDNVQVVLEDSVDLDNMKIRKKKKDLSPTSYLV